MKKWPHSPVHIFNEKGTYMVTAATLHKENHFKEHQHLDYLQNLLLELAQKHKWNLEAWSIFSNHYHFIAQSPEDPSTLQKFITQYHSLSAKYLNKLQETPGRRIWYQYWDTRITFQNSYLARLNYIMQNPVKHGMVNCSSQYDWCSVSWFKEAASKSYYETVTSMKIDGLSIFDDF